MIKTANIKEGKIKTANIKEAEVLKTKIGDRISEIMEMTKDPDPIVRNDALQSLKILVESYNKIDESSSKKKLDPNVILTCITGGLQVGLIVFHEYGHVIASKALTFVKRM